MSPHAAYSSSSELRTRSFGSPELLRLQDEDAYSLPHHSSSNVVIELHPNSPLQTPMQTSSSSSSHALGSEPLVDDKDSSSASERERSQSVASSQSEGKSEKRKRSRVTPEQLQHLERFFLHDRNPNAARRREISEFLGMQERQTQIWFQNRRAKARLPDGRQRHRRITAEIPLPDSPPQLSASVQDDLHNLIHEDDSQFYFNSIQHAQQLTHYLTAVTIIPCTHLSIGSWKRIATTVAKHDLVAYVSDVKRCLTWFIHSDGFGFKMEIPFNTIVKTKLTNADPGSGLASFILSKPPLFYLENIEPPSIDGNRKRHWRRGSDWTEGQQASHVLRHDLIGSAPQLSHLLHNLHNIPNQVPADISLHQPSYRPDRSNQSTSSVAPMEIPPPPLTSLAGPEFRYRQHDTMEAAVSHHNSHFEKRSSYVGPGVTPSLDTPYSNEGDRPPPYSAPSTISVSFAQQPSRHSSATFSADGSDYTSFDTHGIHRSHSADDFSELSVSHSLAPRPYSAQPISRSFYNDTSYSSNTSQLGMQSYHTQGEDPQIHRASTPSSATSVYTTHEQLIPPPLDQQHFTMHTSPSPPLLTTPYHPPPHLFNRPVQSDQTGRRPSPLNSSYSGIDY
ncbi:hypothetical protein C0995_001253 [Termitomyces sp. Mi166|nr:hypothetical protein C0995_001253 [Termitomyces sp. Mi166\